MARLAYAQFFPVFGHPERNLEAIQRLAGGEKADLFVFPELATTGYEFKSADESLSLGETFGEGPTSHCLLALAKQHGATIVMGYAEREGDRAYNSAMLATPQGELRNYRKLHLFDREKQWFTPGDAPPLVVETPVGRVGLMICFDWFFPETARLLALGGAQVIAHPSNLVMPYCQRAMYARSIENRVFTITANRIGMDDRAGRSLRFTGGSQILDIRGNVLAQAPEDQESVGVAEADLSLAANKRLNENNDLFGDRRVEFYEGLL
jgi:predicted amidohydrolase